ncbi:prolyl oligopeptidase-like protein [Wilcoxina mikolae CBS 423.85]|nr:prolyl oligopeptidase-like protein [Wilcoxina mikolae CBS 423.85]
MPPLLPRSLLRNSNPAASFSRLRALRLYSTSIETVPLAFTRHDPPADSSKPASNSPLVILHGLFGSKQNNRSISKAFAKDLNTSVYALDLRNHGDSPHVKRHDYEAMAADVEAFLHDHKLGPNTILMGHSMGAKAAMALALRRPKLISKIISVDNAPIEATLASSFGNYVQAMRRIEGAHIKKQSDADAILKQFEEDIGIRQFLLTNLTKPKGEEFLKFRIPVNILRSALDTVGSFPFHPDKVRCTKPALFVRGTKSHYVPDEVIPIIGQFFPMFTLQDIDSGHWVMSEKPHEFKEAVLEWLQKDHEQ